jgi:hypothetical protein
MKKPKRSRLRAAINSWRIKPGGSSPSFLIKTVSSRFIWLFRAKPDRSIISKYYRLPPFESRFKVSPIGKFSAVIVFLLFSFIYGSAFALFFPYFMYPLVIPLVFLAALVLWALPESAKSPQGWIEPLLVAFLVGLVMWPNYLALAIPGIPRITILRLVGVPLALCLLLCLSVSSVFRIAVYDSIKSVRSVAVTIFSFFAIQIISVAWSANKGFSVNLLLNIVISWIFIYLSSIYVTRRRGAAERIAAYICVMAVILVFIGVWEEKLNHLPWLGHIPSFLQINDPTVERILAGTARQGKGHRIQATFSTSLSLAEYFALSVPFFLHFAATKYRNFTRILAAVSLPLVIIATVLTQARTGLLGITISILLYPVVSAYIYWRNHKSSFAASALVLASPLVIVFGMAAAIIVPGIRIRLLGGGAESYSNDARKVQMSMGIPKILHHPWGYGVGQGAETLGFTNAAGMLTIDSYPLLLALEYGVFGLILWFLIYLFAFSESIRAILVEGDYESDREYKLLIPIAIALIGFVAMKVNLAQEDNEPVVYLLLGLMTSLIARRMSGMRGLKAHSSTLTLA